MEDRPWSRYFDPTSAADLALTVSGQTLYCHKVVLAQRSQVLRELIEAEERPGVYQTEVLLEDTRVEVGKLLLEYLYRDELTTRVSARSPSLVELSQVAQRLELPRLEELCHLLTLSDSTSVVGPM